LKKNLKVLKYFNLLKIFLKGNGGKISKSITKATTHLITTKEEFEEKSTSKVKKAIENNLIIVSEDCNFILFFFKQTFRGK
jgi:NAD-dependent DNA ligase